MNRLKPLGKSLITLFVLLVLILAGWQQLREFLWPVSFWKPKVQHYSASADTLHFQEIWSVVDYKTTRGLSQTTVLVSTGTEALFLGSNHPKNQRNSVIRIDISSGQVNGRIDVDHWSETIASNSRLLYIGVDTLEKIDSNTLKEASEVVAYDLSSGQQVWRQPIRGARSILALATYENIITVFGNTSAPYTNRYEYLNAATGVVLYSSETDYPVFYRGDIWYILQPPVRLQAIESRTNTNLWNWEPRGHIYYPPVLDNDVIIVLTGLGVGTVYALDSLTGKLLWDTVGIGIYSNIAVSNGVAFFLTERAELIALDSRTGRSLATLQFQPESSQDGLTQHRTYNVAAYDDTVLVYLGDSYQLFAFRFSR